MSFLLSILCGICLSIAKVALVSEAGKRVSATKAERVLDGYLFIIQYDRPKGHIGCWSEW